jgi:hypothetical protein
MNKKPGSAIGRAAALLVAVETVVFAVSLIWELVTPSGFARNLGYIASLLIAPSVVTMMACFYDVTRGRFRILGLLALVSSVIYAPFCISTYYLQLSVVAFNPLGLSSEVLKAINFVPGSPTFAIDMLGYGFLCLSTLAAGLALVEAKDRVLRALNIFHGALAVPTFAAPILSGVFRSTSGQANDVGNYVLVFWCIVFAPLALLFVRYFQEGQSVSA